MSLSVRILLLLPALSLCACIAAGRTSSTDDISDSPNLGTGCTIRVTNQIDQNGSTSDVNRLFIVPAGAPEWGENWLDNGLRFNGTVDYDADPGDYDLQIEDNSFRDYSKYGLNCPAAGVGEWVVVYADRD